MPAVFSTISAASSARRRPDQPRPKPAPLTQEERQTKQITRETRQALIDEWVNEWKAYTMQKAAEYGAEFDLNPRYFLDIFFQGGAKMVHHQERINPFNALKSEKAAENRELGALKKAQDIHDDIIEEYRNLTNEEKDALVTRFKEAKDRNFNLRRDMPRARVQDVANVVRNMKMLMYGLASRVGIEGFFSIVHNRADFYMAPEWFFTSNELENYMPIATRRKWVTGEVGMRIEAFAVVGCDPMNTLRTSKQKADWLKAEIRTGIEEDLIKKSGDPKAKMSYKWYEEDIVQKYNIVMEGWTAPRFVNPSELSTSLSALCTLNEAVKSGSCAFRKMLPVEAAARVKKWLDDVAAGHVIAKHCALSSAQRLRNSTQAGDADDSDTQLTGENNSTAPLAKKQVRKAPANDQPPCTRKTATKSHAKAALRAAPSDSVGARDDEVTQAAREQLRAKRPKRSRKTVHSDDEGVDEAAAASAGTAGALVPYVPQPST
ncbi:hypothetical protein C8R45DRAFT_1096671 [Mycena sanguinolenta]|nr:hypothetical protein C8R45DRAFT_1096671 [Mycena sanguinolenta]